MTLDEIKAAVLSGKTVYWASKAYEVRNYGKQWLIVCTLNNSCTGLTHRDGVTMNEKPEKFFVE